MGIPILGWVGIAGLVLILALGTGLKIESSRLAAAKQETVVVQGKFDNFVTQTKTLGEAQAAKAKAADLVNQQFKEKADADLKSTKGELALAYADYRRLRSSAGKNPRGSIVPQAPSGARSPERVCYNRADLASAISSLDTGVTGLLEKGDTAIKGLGIAMKWATSLSGST